MSKIGKVFIIIGILLIGASLALFIKNYRDNKIAEDSSKKILSIMEKNKEEKETIKLTSSKTNESYINGDLYMGILYIPALNMELPIMSNYSYENLQKAPCIYYGSIKTNDLIICAHSYKAHFKYLNKLNTKDYIIIKDTEEKEHHYQVVSIEILDDTDVIEMIENEYDLTLYTCTSDGKKRITIRCNKIALPVIYN